MHMMKKYHHKVGLPCNFRTPTHTIRPVYTRHAREQARLDRYGYILLPYEINLSEYKVFEIGIEDGKLVHMGVEGRYDSKHKVTFVFKLDAGKWIVKTVWLNELSDGHRTLNRAAYAQK